MNKIDDWLIELTSTGYWGLFYRTKILMISKDKFILQRWLWEYLKKKEQE